MVTFDPFSVWSAPPMRVIEVDGLIIFGDMAVPEDSVEEPEAGKTLGAVRLDVEFWTDGVLPIVFADGISEGNRAAFFRACSVWESVADVACVEGPYEGRSLRVGNTTSGCWALLGMERNFGFLRRRMNLSDGCWSHATLLHELGHVFGLIHEHQRPDRDPYVTVFPENITWGFLGLQVKVNFAAQEIVQMTEYDFRSIMHYDRKAFSKNGKDTLLPTERYWSFRNTMGNVSTISQKDGELLSKMYGAPQNVHDLM